MAPLTRGRTTPARSGGIRELPVKGETKLFGGALVALTLAGFLVPMAAATGLRGIGRCEAEVDNAAGADGDLYARISAGIHRYENSAGADEITAGDIGRECYGVDDATVAKTNGADTRSPAGIIFDVDASGVWVDFSAPGGLAMAYERVVIPTLTGTPATRFIATSGGRIAKITSVLQAALTTGNASLSFAINGAAITDSLITITQAGSAAGDLDTSAPTAANLVEPGDVITITVGGTNASAVAAHLLFEIVR